LFRSLRKRGARGVQDRADVAIPRSGRLPGMAEKLLPHVDVFLPNHHEGELIQRREGHVAAGEFFHALGCGRQSSPWVTRARSWLQKGRRLRSGVYAVPFVDASGGGDAFARVISTACCTVLGPATACASRAPSAQAACGQSARPPACSPRAECEAFMSRAGAGHRDLNRVEAGEFPAAASNLRA